MQYVAVAISCVRQSQRTHTRLAHISEKFEEIADSVVHTKSICIYGVLSQVVNTHINRPKPMSQRHRHRHTLR